MERYVAKGKLTELKKVKDVIEAPDFGIFRIDRVFIDRRYKVIAEATWETDYWTRRGRLIIETETLNEADIWERKWFYWRFEPETEEDFQNEKADLILRLDKENTFIFVKQVDPHMGFYNFKIEGYRKMNDEVKEVVLYLRAKKDGANDWWQSDWEDYLLIEKN